MAVGSVENLGLPTTEVVSGTTIEPLLHSEIESAINVGLIHAVEDTETTLPAPVTKASTVSVTESSATLVASCDWSSLAHARTGPSLTVLERTLLLLPPWPGHRQQQESIGGLS